jgi:hypothetical protein
MQNFDFMTPTVIPLNFTDLFLNFSLCVVGSFLLRQVFIKRSLSLSGKFHIGTVIPILATVTFLVIMIVKSSLALSLGLVGALSIVRFRTPIKEPEELAYLFLAIAIGLGYGANQTLLTSIMFVLIIVMILIGLSRRGVVYDSEFNIHIEWPESRLSLNLILESLAELLETVEVQKYASGANENSLFVRAQIDDVSKIQTITSQLAALDGELVCQFYESRPLQ